MEYFNPVYTKDGYILSIDKIRFNFNLSSNMMNTFSKYISNTYDYLPSLNCSNPYLVKQYKSYKQFDYNTLLIISNVINKNSFQLGLGFNSIESKDRSKCFIEFNPNKCFNDVSKLILYLQKITYGGLELNRYDIAIDIPVSRSSVYLMKDNRIYCKYYGCIVNDSQLNNFTEYLGQRNNPGYVKLYNKTIESKLDYDLTRLEITMDSFRYDDFQKYMPVVSFDRDYEINNLKESDRVLYELLIHNPSKNLYLKALGRKQREKFTPLLFNSQSLSVSESDYYKIVLNVKNMLSDSELKFMEGV